MNRSRAWLLAFTAVGAAGVGASFLRSAPERFWSNWVLWFLFFATLALGALFLVALEHLVGARWSVPLRRVPERLSTLLFLAAPLGVTALLSLPVLYPWTRPEAHHDPFVAGKLHAWLNAPFFSARLAACLALWFLSYWVFVRGSIRQDATTDPALTVRFRRFAPAFMAIYAVSVTLIAFDWLSSLDPAWYSDIFGVYVFAGSFLSGLAATVLGAVYLLDRGRLGGVRRDHLYNLGGFLFAFTVFWSYIGFAQYMLMWYADLPEEVYWYADRTGSGWQFVAVGLALVHFVIPFFALIPREKKGEHGPLKRIAVLYLAAHLLDLYWLIFPSNFESPAFSWPEVSFAMFFVSLGLLWAGRSMALGRDMPEGDPFLKEGLEFRL
ncbi:MAG: quinol:cytochrome C oxidoreductase [Acidobacteriota bacterium]